MVYLPLRWAQDEVKSGRPCPVCDNLFYEGDYRIDGHFVCSSDCIDLYVRKMIARNNKTAASMKESVG